MPDEAADLLGHAQIYLENAEATLARGSRFFAIVYDEARHATELACKALLLRAVGSYPQRGAGGHRLGGLMAREGLIPMAVAPRKLNRLLDQHTRGSYGFSESFSEEEVVAIVDLSRLMLVAARGWPTGSFHPPVMDET